MKAALATLFAVLGGLAFWYFSGDKWSGYRWNTYIQQQACIPAKLAQGSGPKGNLLELSGEGETAPYGHRLSVWSCADGKLLAVYEGLPGAAPPRLVNQDMLRFRHGLLAGDDSRRFITQSELAGMHSIADWARLSASRPL